MPANFQHDDFFGSLQLKRARVRSDRAERPDILLNMHTGRRFRRC